MMFALISACGGGNGDLIPEDSVQNGIEATSTNAEPEFMTKPTQKPADTETWRRRALTGKRQMKSRI